MSIWVERFQSHQVWQDIPALQRTIAEVMGDTDEGTAPEYLERFEGVVAYLTTALRSVDAALVSLAVLDTISANLQGASGELRSFGNTRNDSYLTNASANVDAVLTQLANIPVLRDRKDAEKLAASINSLRQATGNQLRGLNTEASKLRAALLDMGARARDVAEDIGANKGVLAAAITQTQGQFLQEQQSRATEFRASEAQRAADVQQLLRQHRSDLDVSSTAHQTAMADLRESGSTSVATMLVPVRVQAGAELSEIVSFKEQAEHLLGIVGTTTVISGYKRVADAAERRAAVWSYVTVGAIIAFTAGTVAALLPIITGVVTVTWETLAGRIVLSLSLGVLGTYAARQASRHEEIEIRNRRLELELSSIGPFIAGMDDATQILVKQQLVDRLFGRQESGKQEARHTTTSVAEVVKVVLQNLPKIKSG
jgi:hypothetical protein